MRLSYVHASFLERVNNVGSRLGTAMRMDGVESISSNLQDMVMAARTASISDNERYFNLTDASSIISPRNEAAALSLLLQEVHDRSGEGLKKPQAKIHATATETNPADTVLLSR